MNERSRARWRSAAPLAVLLSLAVVALRVVSSGAEEPSGSTPVTPAVAEARDASPPAPAELESLTESDAERAAAQIRESAARRPADEESGPPDLVFAVVDAEGEPVRDMGVLLFRGMEDIASEPLDSRGLARFAPLDAPAEVVVTKGLAVFLRAHADAGGGRRELRLAGSHSVAGRVLVDGAEPTPDVLAASPIELQLQLVTDPASSAPLPLPDLRDRWWSLDRILVHSAVGRGGAFAFEHLSADWSGELILPFGYLLDDGSDRVRLNGPADGLVLSLRAPQAIRGRAMRADGSALAGEARVDFDLSSPDRGLGFSGSVPVASDGRFSVALAASAELWPDGVHARLAIDAGCDGGRDVDVRVDPATGVDLGDLLLDPAVDLSFLVVDADGHPIPGALGWVGSRWSEPTDASGLGAILCARTTAGPLTAGALRYHETRVPVRVQSGEPLKVVLCRAPSLEILVRFPDGEPAPGLDVVVSVRDNVFLRAELMSPLRARLDPGSFAAWESTPRDNGFVVDYEASFTADEEGRALVTGLRPGVPFDVDVRATAGEDGSRGAILGGLSGVSLGLDEWRSVVIHVAR